MPDTPSYNRLALDLVACLLPSIHEDRDPADQELDDAHDLAGQLLESGPPDLVVSRVAQLAAMMVGDLCDDTGEDPVAYLARVRRGIDSLTDDG